MLRFLLFSVAFTVILRVVGRFVGGILEGLSGTPKTGRSRQAVQMARDPVCGTFVVPDRAVALAEGPRRVFFCSTGCRDTYRARIA